MLSLLPKLADRAFIIGFVLPTVLFALSSSALFGDVFDRSSGTIAVDASAFDPKGQLVDVLIKGIWVWLLAVLLMTLNHGLFRCLEGYVPPLRYLKRRKLRAARRMVRLRAEVRKLGTLNRESSATLSEKRRFQAAMKELNGMPRDVHSIMPTRFGNAIRAFELYPRQVYGAAGVALWLRVAPFVPKELLETVAEARAQVDFLVNCMLFAFLTSCGLVTRISLHLSPKALVAAIMAHNWKATYTAVNCPDLAALTVSVLLMYLLYELALAAIPGWGEAVKACFDVGLPELANKLGFKLPDTEAKRRAFWTAYSQSILYGPYPGRRGNAPAFRPEDWLPKEKPTFLQRVAASLWPQQKE
jgi:hypothetical protein